MIRILILAFCLFFPLGLSADIVVSDAGLFGKADTQVVNKTPGETAGFSFLSAPALTESRAERISVLESFNDTWPTSSGVLLGTLVNNDDEPVRYDDGGVVWEEPKSAPGNGITGMSGVTSAIPEPGSLTLGVCLMGLGLAIGRRR